MKAIRLRIILIDVCNKRGITVMYYHDITITLHSDPRPTNDGCVYLTATLSLQVHGCRHLWLPAKVSTFVHYYRSQNVACACNASK